MAIYLTYVNVSVSMLFSQILMDTEAWHAAIYGVAKSRTWLSDWTELTTWSASWEICMQVRKQELELDMEQQTGSK